MESAAEPSSPPTPPPETRSAGAEGLPTTRKRKTLRLILPPRPPPSPSADQLEEQDDDPSDDAETPPPPPTPQSPTLANLPSPSPRKKTKTQHLPSPPRDSAQLYKPPTAYAQVTQRVMAANRVQEYQRAEMLFRRARHPVHGAVHADACKEAVNRVLEAGPSEAIEAKCWMMLSRRELGVDARDRRYFAENAVSAWMKVLDRTGTSRLPVNKARLGLALAQELLAHATAAAALEEETSDDKMT